jgi:hypothetical protein
LLQSEPNFGDFLLQSEPNLIDSCYIANPILVNLQNVHWDLEGINILLDSIIDKSESGIAGGIVGYQANDQFDSLESIENQTIKAFKLLDSNQASVIAGGIAEKLTAVVQMAKVPLSLKEFCSIYFITIKLRLMN